MEYIIGSAVVFAILAPLVILLNLENRRLAFALAAVAARSPGDTYECKVDVTRGTGPDGAFTASDLWAAAEQIGDGPFAAGIRDILVENRQMKRAREEAPA